MCNKIQDFHTFLIPLQFAICDGFFSLKTHNKKSTLGIIGMQIGSSLLDLQAEVKYEQ